MNQIEYNEKIFSLDRDWLFYYGDIKTEHINSHNYSYAVTKSGGAAGPAGVMFDDSGWKHVNLPHDAMCESEFSKKNLLSHGYKTRKNCWYRKSFKLDKSLKGKQIMLVFEGIAVTSKIYINGSLMERSFSAYSEITIDVTDRIFFGDRPNILSVYVGGLATEGWWYEGIGIYRHVRLYAKNMFHIAHNGVFAKPVLKNGTDNDWTVFFTVDTENSAYEDRNFCLSAEIMKKGKVLSFGTNESNICPADSKKQIELCIDIASHERWDIENPTLYNVVVRLSDENGVIDSEMARIGFRTIFADSQKGFFLNGRHLLLCGTCNHQDHAGVGVAIPDSIHYFRIKRLKEMGTNAYRCAHNMPARELLDACDEYGMLVIDENRNFETREDVKKCVETMVRRDNNHPCIIAYSLFNEEPLQNTETGGQIYRTLKSAVQKLDDSRILTGAMHASTVQTYGAGPEMDMLGINYNIEYWSEIHSKFPQLPIMGTENNSALSTRGCYKTDHNAHVLSNYDDERTLWGHTVKQNWQSVLDNPYIAGVFVWTGFDYHGEPTPYQWPSCSSQFGIMDTCGFPKDSFYYHQACFMDKPVLHLLPHWNFNVGEEVRIMTYTNCEEVEVILNGRSLGRKRNDICLPCEWKSVFEPGYIEAIGYNNGVKVAVSRRVTAGKPCRVMLIPDRDYINDDGNDTIPVTVCITDCDGVIHPTASNLIKFTAIGDCSIIGVGNGDPNSHESEKLPQRHLFAGYCQVLLQSFTDAKEISLKATCTGFEDAEISFEVRHTERIPELPSIYETTLNDWSISKVLPKKPDINMTVSDNDQNSFEPFTICEWQTLEFSNGWRIYHANIVIKSDYKKLIFEQLTGSDAEVSVNGNILYAGEISNQGSISVSITDISGNSEIRLMLGAESNNQASIGKKIVMM